MPENSNKETRAFEETFYNQVAQEIKNKEINEALWTKALSESGNDKKFAEALYIKFRVQNLKDQYDFSKEKEELDRRSLDKKKLDKTAGKVFLYLFIFLLSFAVIMLMKIAY